MNYNTVTATLKAIYTACKYFPNSPIEIVGPGAFTLEHIPQKLLAENLVSIYQGTNITSEYNRNTVYVMVRVLEHIEPTKQLPFRFVAIVPDMEHTASEIRSQYTKPYASLDYNLQRSMFEIYNQGDDIEFDTHKFNSSVAEELCSNVYHTEKLVLDGYIHKLIVADEFNGIKIDEEILTKYDYVPKINDQVAEKDDIFGWYNFEVISSSLQNKHFNSIVLENIFRYLSIDESLYFLWTIHEDMLKYNIQTLVVTEKLTEQRGNSISDSVKYMHSDINIKSYIFKDYIKLLLLAEGYFDIISNDDETYIAIPR